MKRRYLFIIIFCIILTGCNNKGSETEEPIVMEQTEAENENAAMGETSFYGDYEITACRGKALTYAMSEEEIEETIGDTLSYQESNYAYNGNTMETSYQETIYDADQMYEDFCIQASELGIKEKEITLVTTLTEGEFIGNYIYILDPNTLLIYYEGVFFQADRIQSN